MQTARPLAVLTLLFLLLIESCTNYSSSERVLSEQGYTDIQMLGYEPFMCGKDDMFADGFTAVHPTTKKRVKGVVCSSLMKGSTIRYE